MTLREYMRLHGAENLARRLGYTTRGYLDQIVHGRRKPSGDTALKIEMATQGAVRREDIRPDLFTPTNWSTK